MMRLSSSSWCLLVGAWLCCEMVVVMECIFPMDGIDVAEEMSKVRMYKEADVKVVEMVWLEGDDEVGVRVEREWLLRVLKEEHGSMKALSGGSVKELIRRWVEQGNCEGRLQFVVEEPHKQHVMKHRGIAFFMELGCWYPPPPPHLSVKERRKKKKTEVEEELPSSTATGGEFSNGELQSPATSKLTNWKEEWQLATLCKAYLKLLSIISSHVANLLEAATERSHETMVVVPYVEVELGNEAPFKLNVQIVGANFIAEIPNFVVLN